MSDWVPRAMFQSTFNSGSFGATDGMAALAPKPKTAMSTTQPAKISGLSPATTVPIICPSKMAINVPDSIKPLPMMSSFSARYSGRMAYLTGPNSVDCVPMTNRHNSSRGADWI